MKQELINLVDMLEGWEILFLIDLVKELRYKNIKKD